MAGRTDRPLANRPHGILVAALALLAIAGIVSGILQVIVVIRAADLKRSDEINACRAAARVQLVDAPTARALKAFADDDEAALDRALTEADPDQYEDLVRLSITDPQAFLRECRQPGS